MVVIPFLGGEMGLRWLRDVSWENMMKMLGWNRNLWGELSILLWNTRTM